MLTRDFLSHELPAASFILALERICQALLQAEGVLHLLVRELDGDAVSRRSLGDHPLPLDAAGTRDARAVFLDGHSQSEEDGGFILVEHGRNAPAVDDRNPPIEHVGNIPSLAVDCPDACRGNLLGKDLSLLFGYKTLLRDVGPVGAAVRRRPETQRVRFQPCIEPSLIALVGIAPSSELCGSPCIFFVCPIRYP